MNHILRITLSSINELYYRIKLVGVNESGWKNKLTNENESSHENKLSKENESQLKITSIKYKWITMLNKIKNRKMNHK